MRNSCTVLILLRLLPVTALAAEGAPNTLYVGDTSLSVANDSYWTTDADGNLTQSAADQSWNVKYDPSTATLTLNSATIKGDNSPIGVPFGAGIYALCSKENPVALTIELIGTNTITGNYGIFVDAQQGETVGTNASLLIQNSGGDGSLGVSGFNHGIYVKSGTGDASLNIEKATVTSSTNGNSAAGVYVMSSTEAKVSPNLSLAVNGGSLTASGTGNSDGILFYVGDSNATNATTSLTVTDHAIVDARTGGIRASDSKSDLSDQIKVSSGDGTNGGIVFDGTEGTVYGKVELQKDLEIKSGETLTVPNGSSLNCNEKLTNNGTILASGGTVTGSLSSGTAVTTPSITAQQPTGQTVTEGSAAEFSITASDAQTYQWQQSTDNGSSWTDISGATSADYTTETTTTSMDGYQYRCVVKSASGVSVISQAATLTVQAKPASVPVTGVTLDKTTLELFTGGSATLTATVQPDDATSKNVTWQSDNANVATVENGKVTAKAAGTATITVTTEDGCKTATCQVTVLHSNLKYFERKEASCTEPGNIEYWYCEGCNKYFSDEAGTTEIKLEDVVIPATGHHYVNGYCTKCGHRDPDYRPDPISYYNIYVEDVCDGVEVSTSKQVVREGGSITVYVEKDTARYTFDNFKVYYKRSYYGTWDELKEGTQPGEYPIKNIWTHIYIKAEGAEEKEDPTGIESIEGVKVYTKDGSLYVQTPQREQVIIVGMSGAVVKNEEQIGLKQYHGLQPGIYIVRVGDRAYKVRLN